MVENRPYLTALSHAMLILGVLAVAFPLYVTFVASTLRYDQIMSVPMPLLPGDQLLENYSQVLKAGSTTGSSAPASMSTTICSASLRATGSPLGYTMRGATDDPAGAAAAGQVPAWRHQTGGSAARAPPGTSRARASRCST